MGSGPIISWQIWGGGEVEAVTYFLFLGTKISANADWSHEIRRQFFLGRNVMTNLDSMLKSKYITLLTNFSILKAIVFSVVTFSSNILVTWCKQLTLLQRPWWWERLRADGEEDIRGWDGCMASLMQWSWRWANFRRWCRTGRPDLLQFIGSWRVGHSWAAER